MMTVEKSSQAEDPFVSALKVEFGLRLRRLRRSRELSQDELGRKVGMKRGTIAMIEGGRQSTQLHQVFQLARELDASVTELLPTRDDIMHRAGLRNLSGIDQIRAMIESTLQQAREQLALTRSAYEQHAAEIPDTSSD